MTVSLLCGEGCGDFVASRDLFAHRSSHFPGVCHLLFRLWDFSSQTVGTALFLAIPGQLTNGAPALALGGRGNQWEY